MGQTSELRAGADAWVRATDEPQADYDGPLGRSDTLTEAILDLACRGERDELAGLAQALASTARLCEEIARACEPGVLAHSSLMHSSAYHRALEKLRTRSTSN